MLCQACHRFTANRLLCDRCRRLLRPAPDRILTGGVPVHAAFVHAGPARALVHHLKYRGQSGYADLVAEILAPRLPSLPVVPVPRAISRRVKYGVDPAQLIASRLSDRLRVPALGLLRPAVHTRRRAGGDHRSTVPQFGVRRPPHGELILVDDVLTSGRTLDRAVEALGSQHVRVAIVANAVPEVSSLLRPNPSPRRTDPQPNAFSSDSR